ncbi:MAG: hypothetical protein K6A92_01095 [Lachnospiraceae bacterium]|nr:hypothetical protein [Lachnospiraceae bacterium]
MPLLTGYILSGGEAILWLMKIEECGNRLSAGELPLFFDGETVAARAFGLMAFSSNLILYLPAKWYASGTTLHLAAVWWCALVQLLSIGTAFLAAGEITHDRMQRFMVWALYILSPYHILVSYWKADFAEMWGMAWAPLLIWGILLQKNNRKTAIRILGYLGAILALSMIAYGNAAVFFLAGFLLLLYCLNHRNWTGLGILPVSTILAYQPAAYYLRYVLKGGMEIYGIPNLLIQQSGYHFGQFFTSFDARYFYPGLGIALILGLILGLYRIVLEGKGRRNLIAQGILWAVFLFLSSTTFPWNRIQSLGEPIYRLIATLESPVLFMSLATMTGCLFTTYTMDFLREGAGEKKNLLHFMPMGVLIAAIFNGLYLCNHLVYTMEPSFYGR